ncbi:MAG: sensor histidine kinase [Bacteroidota bacterium]|nr:sensor histidine kinase [Bacteroidota bacterium]MDP4193149.1 sensor histidine kinase [Bacteroidota bacterium]MDP4197290.1 sensor histidine kinase [Bacteroidota bacterium]
MYCLIKNSRLAEDLQQYSQLLFNFGNPIYFAVFLTLILIAVFYFAMHSAILPRQKKIITEKNMLETKNIRLMAIFAELDPDPVLRINSAGEIILMNPAAEKSGLKELKGKSVIEIFSAFNIKPYELIKNNKETSFIFFFSDKYYSVNLKGISYLNIAQMYLHDISELKIKEEALRDSQQELKEFSRYLQDKIEDERLRISRELHDDIGQKMVLLKLNLQKDITTLTGNDDSDVYQRNAYLIEGISKDIKSIAYSLRPSTLEEIGLYHSLIKLMDIVGLQSSVKGTLDFINIDKRLDTGLEVTIFRIVQEAISNIVKYSNAMEYNVQLIKKKENLCLMISDEGKGFEINKIAKNKGMGIRNMRERAEIHGGKFKISSSLEEGTVVMINFPLGEIKV